MRNSLIVVAILLVGYGLFLHYGPKPTRAKLQSQWQYNRYCIEKFLRDSKEDQSRYEIVLVGSSLSSRLDFTEVSKSVYNLSFNGGSALTGLSVIAHSATKPRLVLVEINVPERGVDQDLIAKSSGLLPQLSAIFHVENMPINLATSYLYSFVYSLHRGKPAKEANEPVRRKGIAAQSDSHKIPLPASVLNSNMAEFGRLVRAIESNGARVVFFEMPIHPDLESSPREVQVRNSFKCTFPNSQLLGFTQLAAGLAVKTTDGMHLSDEEARVVVENLKGYFKGYCNDMERYSS